MPFQEYLLRVRAQKAQELLVRTDLALVDISLSCGFSSIKYLNNGFEKIYGMTPKEFRRDIQENGLPKELAEKEMRASLQELHLESVDKKKDMQSLAGLRKGVPAHTGFLPILHSAEVGLELIEAFEKQNNAVMKK